jgi:hypothetical protein
MPLSAKEGGGGTADTNILRAHGVANVSEAVYTNALSLDCLLAYGLPKAQN